MKESQNRLLEIFARERERFLAFIRRQTWQLSHLDPEDILSEAFFNLFGKADLVAQAEHGTAYIYRTLRNQVIDARRRERGRRADLDLAQELADDALPADDLLHHQELRARLDLALAAVKPKERAVWTRTEIEGRSFRELAEAGGEPIGTLLARKHRANAKLRKLLADLNPQGDRS